MELCINLCPFKNDRKSLSGIQVQSHVTTWLAGGYRKGESAHEQDDSTEVRKSGSEVACLQVKMIFLIGFSDNKWQIREILWDFRGDIMISKNVGKIKQAQASINEFNNFDKLF